MQVGLSILNGSLIDRHRAGVAQIRLDGTHGGLARPALAVYQPVQGEHAQARCLGYYGQFAVGEALLNFSQVHVMSKKVAESACILASISVQFNSCADRMSRQAQNRRTYHDDD